MSHLDVGVFDHLDRSDLPLAEFYEARLRVVEAYDRAGFFAYHCAEHHLTPGGMAPSPSVFLSAVAQRTKRLRFGPLIYTLPLYHPVRIVEEICMLDQLSGGRLEMGFGRGSNMAEVGYFGNDPQTAHATYVERLAWLTGTLARGTIEVPVNGEMRAIPMPIEPFQKPFPPLWYGVHSIESAAQAARVGSSVVSLDSACDTRAFSDRYRETWSEAHSPEALLPRIGLARFVIVADTDVEAETLARSAYARWYGNFMYTSRLNGYTLKFARPATFDAMRDAGRAIAGTPETVAAFVHEQMRTAGANYFVGQFAFGDLPLDATLRSIELFANRVRPSLPSYREDERAAVLS